MLSPQVALAQSNGHLQLHFMDVWQGDGALLISPKGETVLFDDGVNNHCVLPRAYLQQLGISGIDYHIVSHYHAGHIGCAPELFSEFPLGKIAFDRGNTYNSASYRTYVDAVGELRQTVALGFQLVLDSGSASRLREAAPKSIGLTGR
jgi:competence protein ComEC